MNRPRFSIRTALLVLTVGCATMAIFFTSTEHQVIGQWDEHGARASGQVYPGDLVDIFNLDDDLEEQLLVRGVEVLQFVQHGDLADSIVVRVNPVQKWKLARTSKLRWQSVE